MATTKLQYDFQIQARHWQQAEAFFKDPNNKGKKMNRKKSGVPFSFVEIAGEIYAFSNKKCFDPLGEGAFGKVKVIENKQGERFAVKIEGRGLRGEQDAETKIGQLLGFIKGEGVREVDKPATFKGKEITQKLYTVMEKKEGTELFKQIYFQGQYGIYANLTETKRWEIALEACKVIQALHDKGVIHADIKPENFVGNIAGETITLSAIDFGLSLTIDPNQRFVTANPRGTPDYIAPEVYQGEFSIASDAFALGKMFQDDLKLPSRLFGNLTAENPSVRPSLKEVMQNIVDHLERRKPVQRVAPVQATRAAPALPEFTVGNFEALLDSFHQSRTSKVGNAVKLLERPAVRNLTVEECKPAIERFLAICDSNDFRIMQQLPFYQQTQPSPNLVMREFKQSAVQYSALATLKDDLQNIENQYDKDRSIRRGTVLNLFKGKQKGTRHEQLAEIDNILNILNKKDDRPVIEKLKEAKEQLGKIESQISQEKNRISSDLLRIVQDVSKKLPTIETRPLEPKNNRK